MDELQASLHQVRAIIHADAAAASAARQREIDATKERLATFEVELQGLKGRQRQQQSHLASLEQVCLLSLCDRASLMQYEHWCSPTSHSSLHATYIAYMSEHHGSRHHLWCDI